jgi:hypothetical protein
MQVAILVTINQPEQVIPCTLALDTIRTGFPTAFVSCHLNDSPDYAARVGELCEARNVHFFEAKMRMHQAEWIRHQVQVNAKYGNEPLVLLDGDVIFWENCEDLTFEHPLAGYYVPRFWNEYANCLTMERLHTSFLVIRPQELGQRIVRVWPENHSYLPFDPFQLYATFVRGTPVFYDVCANLYHAVGGSAFDESVKQRYDHLNSASFYKEMYAKLQNRDAFAAVHELARTKPSELRGLYREIDRYYDERRIEGMSRVPDIII